MRVCFTSDLHGHEKLYEQLGELLRAEAPALLILGGDLFCDVDRQRPILPQVEALTRDLLERLRGWRTTLPDLAAACVLGNHELACMRDALLAQQRCELPAQQRCEELVLLNLDHPWSFGGVQWLGYGCTPPSPHWAKDHERLDLTGDAPPDFPGVVWNALEQKLSPVEAVDFFLSRPSMAEELSRAPRLAEPWAIVAHAPPHDSRLDRLPQVPHPIGSRAVRRFLEERRPMLALHGHVHESPELTGGFTDALGGTLCVNPGQGKDRLRAALFELENPAQSMRRVVVE